MGNQSVIDKVSLSDIDVDQWIINRPLNVCHDVHVWSGNHFHPVPAHTDSLVYYFFYF